MTTREGLMAAILAAPDDDLPRLVFADWLEENGEADHAEFIRVQCEIETHKPEAVNYVRNGRYKREDAVRLDWRLVALHDREMQLLWAKHHKYDSANWELWCHAEAREEDGTPCCANGRGGMSVTPHGSIGLGEGSNSCVVPFSFTEAGPPYDSHGRQVVQYFRRGFVSEIRCTFAGWRGGVCRRCGGRGVESVYERGEYGPNRYQQTCPDCHRDGTKTGIGPAIVRSHPVTRVVLNGVVRPVEADPAFGMVYRQDIGPLWPLLCNHPRYSGNLISLGVAVTDVIEKLESAVSDCAIEWAKSVTPGESGVQQRTEGLA